MVVVKIGRTIPVLFSSSFFVFSASFFVFSSSFLVFSSLFLVFSALYILLWACFFLVSFFDFGSFFETLHFTVYPALGYLMLNGIVA